MMRHVSVFRFKPEYRTEEIVFRIAEQLRALPEQVPTILESEIGVKPIQIPPESPDGLVQFYDLIQIITFASSEDCAAYPAAEGHIRFVTASGEYMDQVIGIDYPV